MTTPKFKVVRIPATHGQTIKLPKTDFCSLSVSFKATVPDGVKLCPYDLPDECEGMNIEQVEAYAKQHGLRRYNTLEEQIFDTATFELLPSKPFELVPPKPSKKRGCKLYKKP